MKHNPTGGSGAWVSVSSVLRIDVSFHNVSKKYFLLVRKQYLLLCLSFKPSRNTELFKSSLYIYELQIFSMRQRTSSRYVNKPKPQSFNF